MKQRSLGKMFFAIKEVCDFAQSRVGVRCQLLVTTDYHWVYHLMKQRLEDVLAGYDDTELTLTNGSIIEFRNTAVEPSLPEAHKDAGLVGWVKTCCNLTQLGMERDFFEQEYLTSW